MEPEKLLKLLAIEAPPEQRPYPYEDDLSWRFVLPATGLLLVVIFVLVVRFT